MISGAFAIVLSLSRQIYAVPDLCCIVSRRLVKLVEHVKDELAVIPCLLLATL